MATFISGQRYLSYDEALHNANIIAPIILKWGFTNEAVAGILGNMWRESHVNPAMGEETGTGYGFTQWTPKSKLLARLSELGLTDTGNNQLKVLEKELGDGANNSSSPFSQWYDVGEYTLAKLKTTTDVIYATEAFCYGYERPGVTEMDERITYAKKFLTDVAFTGDSTDTGVQLAVFPIRGSVVISQGENGEYSHMGSYAIDFAKPENNYPYYAPFDCHVVNTDSESGVYWESDKVVRWVNGTTEYVTLVCYHDDNYQSFKIGDTRKKGDVLGHSGTSGNVTGDHAHLQAGKGKYESIQQNSQGVWVLTNEEHLYNIFSICDNTNKALPETTFSGETYPWVCLRDFTDGSSNGSSTKRKRSTYTLQNIRGVFNYTYN